MTLAQQLRDLSHHRLDLFRVLDAHSVREGQSRLAGLIRQKYTGLDAEVARESFNMAAGERTLAGHQRGYCRTGNSRLGSYSLLRDPPRLDQMMQQLARSHWRHRHRLGLVNS